MVGIPYCKSPPTLSFLSKTVTKWPALFSWLAHARPAGPDPTMATLLLVRLVGTSGTIQPWIVVRNIFWVLFEKIYSYRFQGVVNDGALDVLDSDTWFGDTEYTGGFAGAGQTLPVNSGSCWSAAADSMPASTGSGTPAGSIWGWCCPRDNHESLIDRRGHHTPYTWRPGRADLCAHGQSCRSLPSLSCASRQGGTASFPSRISWNLKMTDKDVDK